MHAQGGKDLTLFATTLSFSAAAKSDSLCVLETQSVLILPRALFMAKHNIWDGKIVEY